MKRHTAILVQSTLVAIVLAWGSSTHASCTTAKCLQATNWHRGFSAVVIDSNPNTATYHQARELIHSLGGYVGLESYHLFLGWIDPKLDRWLVGRYGIRAIYRSPGRLRLPTTKLDPPLERHRDQVHAAFFESVVNGSLAAQVERGFARPDGPPLTGDARDTSHVRSINNLDLEAPHLRAGIDSHTGTPWHFESMRGRIFVIAFEMESDGAIDPNTYTYASYTQYSDITQQILAGFAFWADQARARGITLSFSTTAWEPYALNVQTGYEPFLRSSSEDYLWVNDILRKQDTNPPYLVCSCEARPGGFGAGLNPTRDQVFAAAEEFNEHVRTRFYSTTVFDWAISIFIAYDGGQPLLYRDGMRGAFAYYGGPWIQMSYTNSGWGPERFYLVADHELAHTFWACDEYYDQPSDTGCFTCANCRSYGPRLTLSNANCGNPNPTNPPGTSCIPHQSCMMDTLAQALCQITPQQIGW